MDRSSRLVPLLSILVALALAVYTVGAFLVPAWLGFLPWAGAAAGVLAVLQSLNLRNAAPAVRWTLALAGFAAAVFMLAVQAFR